jgi:hypothetical protein
MGPVRSFIASVGAKIIYSLIWIFGKRTSFDDSPWLRGPIGNQYIGDQPYDDCARLENLTVVRDATSGGLVDDFGRAEGKTFRVAKLNPRVRDFYENTAQFSMDVWAKTYFPSRIALWLLVTTISRKVNQLNFPVNTLERTHFKCSGTQRA